MSLTIRVEIAPGGSPTADPATLTWRDITAYAKAKIRITRGRQDEQGQTQPASCSLRVDNAGGRFVPSNPIGPYYGQLERNCPIRVSINISGTWHVRFTGYVDAWPVKWSAPTDSYVDVTASGIMRRLTKGEPESRGALYRYISEYLPWARLAYWPLEDGADSKQAASADDQAGPMWTSGTVRFGTAAPLSGVTTLVDPSGGYLGASLPQWYAFNWRVEFVAVWNAPWGTNQRPISWLTPGSVAAWNVVVSSAGLHLDGFKTDVALVETQVVNIDTAFVPIPGQLHHIRVDTTMSGTTMQVRMYVDGVQYGSTASLLSSSTLPPTHVRINPDKISTDDTPLMGHLAIWADPSASDTPDAARGWVGQTAHERIEALCAAEGVPYSPALGATVTSEPMGPQPRANLMAILRDCESTDGGILYELTSGALTYLRRKARYNAPVDLAASYTQLAPTLEPVDDDQALANDFTVKRPGGSDHRYVDAEHLASEGRYEDSADVNVQFDERLPNHAAWRVRQGTVADLRYPSITLNFIGGAQPLIAQWLACDIGSRISVDDLPVELPPDPLDLILEGYTETLDAVEWSATLNCSPAAAYTVAVRGTARRNTAGSQLAAANTSAQATDTSLTRNYIVIPDVSAAGFSVGDRVVLHDSTGYRKEPGVFTVTSKASGLGFTNVSFTPAAAELPTGVFAGAGDTIRRVDQTSLLVATTLGPLWTTSAAQMPIDINIGGERLTVSSIESTVRDTWSRTVAAGGLGTSDSGHAWSIPFGTAANFSANGSQGLISVSAINAEQHATVDLGVSDIQEVRLWLTLPVTPTGAQINWGILLRYVDSNNYCWADVQVGTDSSLTLRLIKRVAGTATQLVTAASGVTHSTSVPRILQARAAGSTLYSKVWASDATEPGWQLDTTDASLPAGTQVGVVARLMTGNTNATPVQFRADNLAVVNPQTFTVVRAANGVEKAHSAGVKVGLWAPARRAL